MTQIDARYESYTRDYEETLRNSSKLKREFKTRAWEAFSEVGLPIARKGNEKWKYTNVNPVLNETYRIHRISMEEDQIRRDLGFDLPNRIKIIVINGVLLEESILQSEQNPNVQISSLNECIETGSKFVIDNLSCHASYADGFVALNSALFEDGIYIETNGNNEDTSVEIIHISTGTEKMASYPRLLVNAKANSTICITEAFFSQDINQHFTNSVTEIVLSAGANVTHNRVMFESLKSVHMGVTNIYQSEGSNFKSTTFSNGSDLARNEVSVLLDGNDAACDLVGLYLTIGDQHIDNLINIDHAKPNCYSNITYKGILDGESRAVFGGEVLVRKDSQKTNATQSDKNLILSEGAEVDSKPSLMIYADDVQCGHGATAGSINDDTVFYMRSRGLDEKTASKFLIQAFAREIIEQIDDTGFMEYIDKCYEESIPDAILNLG